MHDKIVTFIENHRILSFIIIIFVIIFGVLCGLRFYNKNIRKTTDAKDTDGIEQADGVEQTVNGGIQLPETSNEAVSDGGVVSFDDNTPKEKYTSDLSINARDKKKQEQEEAERAAQIEEEERQKEEEKRLKEAIKNKKPTYGDEVICWDTDGVPETMVDGSSVKAFYSQCSLSDFDSKWGGKLTDSDKVTKKLYLVGVDQNPDDTKKGYSSQSLGWLIENFDKLNENACIKFTDLNTIGRLSEDHVALLCNYDWYSAFGMDDTMVVFEDISNSLEVSKFKSGTIFSAYVYKHNIKVKRVHGQNVVCIQYNKFQ